MLMILAILAGPVLAMTILMIVVFEIKDAWAGPKPPQVVKGRPKGRSFARAAQIMS